MLTVIEGGKQPVGRTTEAVAVVLAPLGLGHTPWTSMVTVPLSVAGSVWVNVTWELAVMAIFELVDSEARPPVTERTVAVSGPLYVFVIVQVIE